MIWEPWAGLVERGRLESLKLFKLKPAMTKRRAPGPGAITKTRMASDWKEASDQQENHLAH